MLDRVRAPQPIDPSPATHPITEPQRPIRDYALIGDCHGAALVARDGGIHWCALGRFDADPVFCSLLDASQGGFLAVRPVDAFETTRAYLPGTNILRTVFTTHHGKVAVTDFMPVGRRRDSWVHDYTSLVAPALLIRRIEGLEGRQHLDVTFRPSIAYGKRPARLTRAPGAILADEGVTLWSDLPLTIAGDLAGTRAVIDAGEARDIVVGAGAGQAAPSSARIDAMLATTTAFWQEWIDYNRYEGPYRDIVGRSALLLKLLSYAPTGALVAAPTTSLPERIGGERNWDYRYTWIRDASFTLYALAVLGYSGEARAFNRFLRGIRQSPGPPLQIMYGIDGRLELPESVLEHLEGYRGSRPVRVGNAAYSQRQADVYGELLDGLHVMHRLGARLDREDYERIERIVTYVESQAEMPDQGLWETRTEPRHHVHGKIQSWIALDRALECVADRPSWRALRDRLRGDILARGVDATGRHLVQAYGGTQVDAALLTAPLLGFPVDRPLFARTVERIERDLRTGDFLERYRTEDGLPGGEGAFLLCTSWLVDAYLWLGRTQEAVELFDRLVAHANDVGLFSEQIDPSSLDFLGNFPQAFTHLGIVGNAINLTLVEKYGAEGLAGGNAKRAQRAPRAVGATFGWRALWEACRATGRVGRLRSSRRSMMSLEPGDRR